MLDGGEGGDGVEEPEGTVVVAVPEDSRSHRLDFRMGRHNVPVLERNDFRGARLQHARLHPRLLAADDEDPFSGDRRRRRQTESKAQVFRFPPAVAAMKLPSPRLCDQVVHRLLRPPVHVVSVLDEMLVVILFVYRHNAVQREFRPILAGNLLGSHGLSVAVSQEHVVPEVSFAVRRYSPNCEAAARGSVVQNGRCRAQGAACGDQYANVREVISAVREEGREDGTSCASGGSVISRGSGGES